VLLLDICNRSVFSLAIILQAAVTPSQFYSTTCLTYNQPPYEHLAIVLRMWKLMNEIILQDFCLYTRHTLSKLILQISSLMKCIIITKETVSSIYRVFETALYKGIPNFTAW
jgi:hypothetical protein